MSNNTHINGHLFDYQRFHSPTFYLSRFGRPGNMIVIRQIDYERSLALIRSDFADLILESFSYTEIDCSKRTKKPEEFYTVFVLQDEMVLELSDDYCEILYRERTEAIGKLTALLTPIRKRERRKPLEINMLTRGNYGLELTELEVKRTKLDLSLYYEEDFAEIDTVIRKRLNSRNDKGIVLLHGTPGTGKTTYLRWLIGKIRKRVMFLPPNMAGQMTQPELVKLLLDHPNSVLFVEDAENVIMQRQAGHDSSVSTLLNMADGLLSDFMNVQIVCTFNSPLSTVDQALLRKGRLIAKYEFGKLSVEQARRLSIHAGFTEPVTEPMTVAEVFNRQDKNFSHDRTPIGFRTAAMLTI